MSLCGTNANAADAGGADKREEAGEAGVLLQQQQVMKSSRSTRTPRKRGGRGAGPPPAECCHGFCALLPITSVPTAEGETRTCNYCWQVKRPSDRPLFALAALAVIALVVGIILPVIFDKILNDGIDSAIVVNSEDADAYDAWSSNTDTYDTTTQSVRAKSDAGVPIYYDIYAFDIVNPQTAARGEKPILVERGPYHYHELFEKFDVEWEDGGDIVTFYTWKYFVFDEKRSYKGAKDRADERDIVTQVYMVANGLQVPISAASAAMERAAAPLRGDVDAPEASMWNEEGQMLREMLGPIRGAKSPVPLAVQDSARNANVTIVDWIQKLVLCSEQYEDPAGITPFRDLSVHDLYWGYWNDPIMVALKSLLNALNTHLEEPIDLTLFTTSVPGLATNLTDKDDARRRSNRDRMLTGNGNVKDVMQFVLYQNMSKMHVCLFANNEYSEPWDEEAQEWPACAHYQSEWDEDAAEEHGWTLMWDPNSDANDIHGTDASIYKRVVRNTQQLDTFISDIYRSAFVEYQKTVKDFHHIKLFRFGLRDMDMQNASEVSVQADYYQFGPAGVENMTSAAGLPLFASKPHFLDGDVRLLNGIEGILPIREAHDTYLDVEPQTGASMRVHKRLQVSNYLESYTLPAIPIPDALQPYIAVLLQDFLCFKAFGGDGPRNFREQCDAFKASTPNFVNVTIQLQECISTPSSWTVSDDAVYIPYAWADEHFEYNSDDASDFKRTIYGTEKWESQLQLWSFIVSGAMFVATAVLLATRALVRHEHGVDPYEEIELHHHSGIVMPSASDRASNHQLSEEHASETDAVMGVGRRDCDGHEYDENNDPEDALLRYDPPRGSHGSSRGSDSVSFRDTSEVKTVDA